MYASAAADIYDLQHRGRGKDYRAEAGLVLDLVRERHPQATTLLDVACGTGLHLEQLLEHFVHVEGVDLSEDMIDLARHRLPGVPLQVGDMRTIELPGTYDVITCLFASIAELRSLDDLRLAVGAMASHLTPGGLLIIEPWYRPDQLLEGHVSAAVIEGPSSSQVARVSHTVRDGEHAHMRIHYLLADADRGIQHFTEDYRPRLFSKEQLRGAFQDADLTVEYLPGVLQGRGLYLATAPGRSTHVSAVR